MPARLLANICFLVAMSSLGFAADPASVVEPTGMWSGKIKDESLRKLAPKSGFIADADTWKKLWTTWRPDEELPKVDFAKELILVGTVPGPNLVIMRPTIDDEGNVKFIAGGTKIGGPGFGYKLVKIAKEGVKTVNGKAVNDAAEDSITVTVVGTLRTSLFAVGGETTGTTITAKGITWELEFGENAEFRKTAEKLNGKKVVVQGSLERRKGVEIEERWIVTVTDLKAAVGGQEKKTGFDVKVGREDSHIQLLAEGDTTIIDITSEFGIDRATVKQKSDKWPKSIQVRLHLSGLESFKAGSDNVAVEWSVASTGDHATRASLVSGKRVAEIGQDSPYFAEVRLVGGNGKSPLKDGYFEVTLPAKLFEGNPEELKLRWIDFYRN